eukprot:TRINITY_DN5416_c0_g1_i1.p1 TRINITY_DN5416_c0_g1~~TRINITY_DN5416_c0_g1_i1.p1  ORF type:complete len:313 (-),score=102.32 TRINITY_DN5416_c0_g1_i1:204-1142(-)
MQVKRVKHDFIAEGPAELSIKSGDLVEVSNEVNADMNGWTLVSSMSPPIETGFVPTDYLGDYEAESESNTLKVSIPNPEKESVVVEIENHQSEDKVEVREEEKTDLSPKEEESNTKIDSPIAKSSVASISPKEDKHVFNFEPQTQPQNSVFDFNFNNEQPPKETLSNKDDSAFVTLPSSNNDYKYESSFVDQPAASYETPGLSQSQLQLDVIPKNEIHVPDHEEQLVEMLERHEEWFRLVNTEREETFSNMTNAIKEMDGKLDNVRSNSSMLFERISELNHLIVEEKRKWVERLEVERDIAASKSDMTAAGL